CIQALEFPLTF
nr:immunoglobulin light chain junction region [Macaca mulatta]MOV81030.1 immunoglobulin light chain junction region [Macaca mulatta]MOV81193.1 immunoglobulin light chain junction region [Macaca mulatta]MOV82111.1 immunoglobulin light chain junction region [Macaca mulatta]MOV84829.1 immunoglobulin light chain junction region [Macaca mulatta]